jgi:dual specificity tyrosine-phosphorylation-regulated kinase 2/3/4
VFTKQLLAAINHMRELHIIHCDMKPENILLSNPNSSTIKVIDLGTGCYEKKTIYTYIQSRFYRAPEIMLGIPYTCAIDMWSLGCILLELHLGYPMFAGEDESEQISMIMEYRGIPSAKVILV